MKLLFYFFSFLMLGAAIYVAVVRDVARVVFCFFGVLFCLAGLYIFALADFVAVAQVLVYVGGVVVLMIFALMLTDKRVLEAIRTEERRAPRLARARNLPSLLLSLGVLILLLLIVHTVDWPALAWLREAASGEHLITGGENMVQNIGVNLMTVYLLPFEVVSVFLLAALVGAAYLARGRKTG